MSDAVRRRRISESLEDKNLPLNKTSTKRNTRGSKIKRQMSNQEDRELRRSRRLRLLPPDYCIQSEMRFPLNNVRPSSSGSSTQFVQSNNIETSSSSSSDVDDEEDDVSSTGTNHSSRSATLTVSLDNSSFVATMSADTDTSSSSSDDDDPIAVPAQVTPQSDIRPEPTASTSSTISFPRPVNLGHRPDLPNRTSLSLAHRQMWLRQQREQEIRRRVMLRDPVRRLVSNEHASIRISELILQQRQQDNNSNATQNLFRELWSSQSRSPVQRYLDNMSQLLERMRRESIRATPEMINSHTILFDFASVHLKSAQTQCVICLSNFELGQKMRRLPCVHLFHRACIDKWLLDNRCCPICRHPISDRKINFADGMARQNLAIRDP